MIDWILGGKTDWRREENIAGRGQSDLVRN
jgi:hypothetical protein